VSIHVLQGERNMATNNMTLGRFELTGIPPAPRGLPQIEVSFDIDANGIVNVSAKDLGTGKEQKIQITASSGLSEAEIQRLIKEAEAHADEDKKKLELIEVRNHADSLIYATEKSLTDLGDKVEAGLKADIEAKQAALKTAMEGENVEGIKSAMDDLSKASHKLAEQLYAQKSQEGGTQQADAGQSAQSKKDDEDVVDADYTEVK
jgi:molecular chaperone DnaK